MKNLVPYNAASKRSLSIYILLGLLCGMSACQKLVSDEALHDNFLEHKSEFSNAIKLFKTLDIQSVDATEQTNDSKPLQQLRSILRNINVRLIRQYPDEIKLIYQGEGSILNGTEKGYSFRATAPSSADTVKSVDTIVRPYKSFGNYYSPLDKNWYIFLFNDA